MSIPQVLRRGIFDCQVCVPNEWTDEQVEELANAENPTGISSGWRIRKEGSELLVGDPERVSCNSETNPGFVHIMLDC